MKYAALIEKTFDVVSKSGAEFTCRCPWCPGRRPVLYANAVRGLYVCFRCHAKGTLDRMGEIPQTTTSDLRERLQRVKTPPAQQTYYPEGWLKQFSVPTDYWTVERGLSQPSTERFGLGFCSITNRATLPLRDSRGRILGVTYRRLDGGKPKYLHPKGFPIGRHLYGAWLLEDQRKVALVEGQVDAVRCWDERVPALALMGSRITVDQIKVLKRCGIESVVLMLDNDNAGQRGTVGIYEALQGSGIRVLSGFYRDYWGVKDPDNLTGQRLRKMYHSAVDLATWARRSGLVG